MKRTIVLIAAMIFLGAFSFAQEDNKDEKEVNRNETKKNKNTNSQEYRTLFGGDETSHGGYGGIMVNYSKIDGKDAVLVGARGGWIINHGITIGLGGYGFVNDMNYDKTIDGVYDNYSLAGGYGGLLIEPIIGAKHPVHLAIPIIIGAGGVSYINNYYYGSGYYPPSEPYYYSVDSDAFFVIEPGLEVELNLVKFFRIAVGGYYRYTSDVHLADTDPGMLRGFSGSLSLKFGKF